MGRDVPRVLSGALVCQQAPGSKSDCSAEQFAGARWAGGFWREVTPRPGLMRRCRAGPEPLLELGRLSSRFGVRFCWVGEADQLG